MNTPNNVLLNTSTTFSHYGKQFQEKIFQGLVTDHAWAAQMIEVMRPSFFDVRYLEYLAEKYFSYFTKYKTKKWLYLMKASE